MPQGGTTPGVCAAVASLTLYDATRSGASGIGSEAARDRAAQVAADYTDAEPLTVSDPLAVEATLPGDGRRAVYVVTVKLAQDLGAGNRRRDLSGRCQRRPAPRDRGD